MTGTSIILGESSWWPWAAGLAATGLALVAWSYARSRAGGGVRAACAALKTVAFATLAVIVLEPLLSGSRPRPGANTIAVLADASQSLQLRDDGSDRTRGDWVRDRLRRDEPWRARLGQDFDVRGYAFDTHLRSVDDFDGLAFDGQGSAIGPALGSLAKRFKGRPLAGAILFTDGLRTDAGEVDVAGLPPIYPVIPPSPGTNRDVGVRDVSVSQTNFESAPVVVRAEVATVGYEGRPIVAVVLDEVGAEVQRSREPAPADGKPLSFRFQFRPVRRGVSFYRVRAFPEDEEPKAEGASPASTEQTLANNERLVVVDQGGGEYRILYVGGRPSWEYKFLHRALQGDEQVRLVGMIRIAKKQPKFDFQAAGGRANKFFEGFNDADAETSEADKPVLIRLDTLDEAELRDGFPKTAEELYRYHAIVVDDLEASFFAPDQLALLRNFVSVRGAGLLMLGGPDSFADGGYDRTAVGELLPAYLTDRGEPVDASDLRLGLTREGMLEPWVRTRSTEAEEAERLTAMPAFRTLSRVGRLKPGAIVLEEVTDPQGAKAPALAAQNFGKGRVAALLIGDLWRWGMRRKDPAESDLEKSWRQTARWLTADVPRRVEVSARPSPTAPAPAVELTVRVRDAEYRPLADAKAALKVAIPGGDTATFVPEPVASEPGAYAATIVPKTPGGYKVSATATAADGATAGEAEAGWASQPAADEFARLSPDRAFLADLAARTGGAVIDGEALGAFAAGLPARGAPITEPWTAPLWDHPAAFLLAVACLAAEWGLRRLNGLA